MMRIYKKASSTGFFKVSVFFRLGLMLILCACLHLYAGQAAADGTAEAPAAGTTPVEPVPVPADGKPKAPPKEAAPLAPTEITSDTLEYDFTKQVITFTGNVHVLDDQIDLQAQRMDVTLNQKTQTVTRIEAIGDVQVKRQDGRSSSERAIYDLVEGTIILTGNPVIHHPQGDIEGAMRVIYERENGKFRTEGGQPRLRIKGRKESDTIKDFISGVDEDEDEDEDKDKDKDKQAPAVKDATDSVEKSVPPVENPPETDRKPDRD